MKRKRISLLCAILSVTMVILLCLPIAFAEDAIPDAKMLSYEDYFENEHGFYLDTITKSKQYLNMSTGLFSPLVQKEANGTITRNGQEVTGIIGNSEIVFFAIDHTVYRYHVKSKRIDAVFTEPMMESFYPITSHKILWKRAESSSIAKAICTNRINGTDNQYFLYDVDLKSSRKAVNPQQLISATTKSGYTNLRYYTTNINGKAIPRTVSGFRFGDIYTDYPNVGASQCQNFGIVVFAHIWDGNFTQFYSNTSWYNQDHYGTNMSIDTMYNTISSYPAGSLIRLLNRDTSYATRHTVILTESVNGYVYVYHANMFGDNAVYITYFSKSQFNDWYKGIDYICYN